MLPSLKQMLRGSDGNYWRRTKHCVILLASLIQVSPFVSHKACERTELPLFCYLYFLSVLHPVSKLNNFSCCYRVLDSWFVAITPTKMHYGHWSDYLEPAEKGDLTGNCIPLSAPQPRTCFTDSLLYPWELYSLVRAIQAFNGALYFETALFAPIYLLGFFCWRQVL